MNQDTFGQFLAQLEQTKSYCRWYVSKKGRIRAKSFITGYTPILKLPVFIGERKFCPITSICYETNITRAGDIAIDMGFSSQEANELVDAADNAPGHNPMLRQQILAAVQLKERVTSSE